MSSTGTSPTAPPLLDSLPRDRALGVDVGGGSTRAVLLEGGAPVADWQLPGGNLTLAPEPLLETLHALCDEARPQRVAIGLAGLRSAQAEPRARLRGLLAGAAPGGFRLVSDAVAALLGAFGGARGTVVCAGTGTVAVGGDPLDPVVIGGHGFLVDDLGGAWDIGRSGLRAALRRHDRGEPSPLGRALQRSAGGDLGTLVARVHAQPAERRLLAELAPLVAASPDPDAVAVVEAAADALVDLAETAAGRWPGAPLAWSGGVFACEPLRARFVAATGARAPLAAPHVGVLLTLAAR